MKNTEPIQKKNYFYTPHNAQELFHDSNARFRVCVCGRQFGKTMMVANELIRHLWNNKGHSAWWCSFRYNITKVGFDYILKQFKPIIKHSDRKNLRIELSNGSDIEFKSTHTWKELVGKPLNYVVIDEAGNVPPEAIFESLLPTLTVTRGKAIFIGTPKGKNWFWELYKLGLDSSNADYESFKFTSFDNPYADHAFIEMRKKDTPIRTFQQEYMAEFLDNVGAVFRNIDECFTDEIKLYDKPQYGDIYTMGVDIAKEIDYTVCSIFNQNHELVRMERFNRIDWTNQITTIDMLAKMYRATIVIDITQGTFIQEALQKKGCYVIGYNFSGGNKKRDLIDNLTMLFDRQEIKFPNIGKDMDLLKEEFRTYEFDINEKNGNVKFSAPKNKHDDIVISCALANWHLKSSIGFSIEDIMVLNTINHFNHKNINHDLVGY
jgi:hypothetical protein